VPRSIPQAPADVCAGPRNPAPSPPGARHQRERRAHSDSATFGRCGREVAVAEQKRLRDQIFVDARRSDSRRCARREYRRLQAATSHAALRSRGRHEGRGSRNLRRLRSSGGRGRVRTHHHHELLGLLERTSSAIDSVGSAVVLRHLGSTGQPVCPPRSVRRHAALEVVEVTAFAVSASGASAREAAISRPGRASCHQLRAVGSKVVRVRESEESNVGVLR